MSVKRCTRCQIEKLVSAFHRTRLARGARASRGGLGVSAVCKTCKAEGRKPGIGAERAAAAQLAAAGLKVCGKCKKTKSCGDFHKRAASHDGVAAKCKACVNAASVEWRERNPTAASDWAKKNRAYNAERFKKWREQNLKRQRDRLAAWAQKNPGKVRAKGARRHASKLSATPHWADPVVIEAIYAQAARITRETGERHEVDHAVPLQSPIVCGLHWEGNLQVLPKAENIAKLNRHWPDMP